MDMFGSCKDSMIGGIPGLQVFREAFNSVSHNPKQAQRFNPYSDDGGTLAAIAGDDFVVVGCDTRLTAQKQIIVCRTMERVFKLNDNVYYGSPHFLGDNLQLLKVLQYRLKIYKDTFNENMTADACAEMLARTLYYKRFFPYYVQPLLVGFDRDGKGAVYEYDSIGSTEKRNYGARGDAGAMISPFLDSQIKWSHQDSAKPEMTVDRAIALIKDAMISASERETTCGDQLNLVILVRGQPVRYETLILRHD